MFHSVGKLKTTINVGSKKNIIFVHFQDFVCILILYKGKNIYMKLQELKQIIMDYLSNIIDRE